MKVILSISLIFLLFTLTACSIKKQAIIQKQRYPFQTLTVLPFKNDYATLHDKIIRAIQKRADKSKQTLSFSEEEAIKEQLKHFSDTPLSHQHALQIAQKLNSDIVILGKLGTPLQKKKRYFKERTQCEEERCWRQNVLCESFSVKITAKLTAIDVKHVQLRYKKNVTKEKKWNYCVDDAVVLPTLKKATERLSRAIALEFAKDLEQKR